MFRRRADPPPPTPVPLGDAVTTEHLKAAVEAGVGSLKTELRWQRWVLAGLAAVVLGPRVPSAPVIAALTADPNIGPHLLELARGL
jgi:hypothetical protein